MLNRKSLLAGVIAAAFLGFSGSSLADIYIGVDPPAPRHEHFEARPGYIVVPGVWRWHNGRHQWVAGHYVAERQGYRYESDRWVMHANNRWTMQRGGWARNHDSDGDGVPYRLDNYPNNPRKQ